MQGNFTSQRILSQGPSGPGWDEKWAAPGKEWMKIGYRYASWRFRDLNHIRSSRPKLLEVHQKLGAALYTCMSVLGFQLMFLFCYSQ